MNRLTRVVVLIVALATSSCASHADRIVADYMFSVEALATDASGSRMRDVRVSIQLLGPPAYDVITPVSEQVGHTNSEGSVNFFFISHEPRYKFNLIFFKEGFKTVWLEDLEWTAPDSKTLTAVMTRSP